MSFDLETALDQAMAAESPMPVGQPDTAALLDAMGLVDPDAAQAAAASNPGPVPRVRRKTDPLDREVKGALLKRLLELRAEANPAREVWPEEWFGCVDSAQVVACQKLWGSVLMASLQEAFQRLYAAARMPARNRPGHERAALAWVGSRDFREVCDLAGFEPDQVETWVRSEATSETPGAVLFGQGKKWGEA